MSSLRSFLIITLVHLLTRNKARVLREVYVLRPILRLEAIEIYVPEGEKRRTRTILNAKRRRPKPADYADAFPET